MPVHGVDVDSIEQPVQLFDIQTDHGLRSARPGEPVLFQPLHQQSEAVAVPAQDFDAVGTTIAEHVDGLGKRVPS